MTGRRSNPPNRRELLLAAGAFVGGMALGSFAFAAGETRPAEVQHMLTRKIPSSGEAVPAIGMGTWQSFDPPSTTEPDLTPLEQVLKTFYDAGGRVVDSSPMYGKAETITGLLSNRLKINEQLFLATKVWTSGREAGIRQMQASMEKLGRQKLDLMQVHNLLDWREHLTTLRESKKQGKLRYIGVTHYQVRAFDELEKIVREEKIDFVQLPYSIAIRDAEKRLLPAARDSGVAVIVNRPFEGGELFAKARKQPLPEFAKPFANSWAQAFLKFILANEAVTCVIPATSKPEHMKDNMQAGIGRLPDEGERRHLALAIAGQADRS